MVPFSFIGGSSFQVCICTLYSMMFKIGAKEVVGNSKSAENLADVKRHKLGTFLSKAYTAIDNSYFKHELQVNVKLAVKGNKILNFKLIHLKFK